MNLPQGTLRHRTRQSSYALLNIGGGVRDPLHLGLGHSLHMSARLYLCSPFVAVDYGVSFRARRERASVSESLEGKSFPPQT